MWERRGRPKSAKPGTRSHYQQCKRDGVTPPEVSVKANRDYVNARRARGLGG